MAAGVVTQNKTELMNWKASLQFREKLQMS